jgi:hypothetical protein
MKRILSLIIALSALALAATPEHALATGPLGIDSPFTAATPNWTTIAGDGISFACIKATAQDEPFLNGSFASLLAGAHSAGIYTIPYNRVDPSVYTPASEAAYFWNLVGSVSVAGGYNLSPAIDIEDGLTGTYLKDGGGTQSLSAWCNQYFSDLSTLTAKAGVQIQPIIYANVGILCDFGSGLSGNLWLASPCGCDPSGSPYTCGGCSESRGWDGCEPTGCECWDIWQYAWDSTIPGPNNPVDLDVYNGTLSQMVGALGTRGPSTQIPLVAPNGALSVFALLDGGTVNTIYQTNAGGAWSTSWANVGGGNGFVSLDGVVLTNGTMALYGCDGGAISTSYQTSIGGAWTSWSSLGGSGFTQVKALIFKDDHMAVVGCGYGTAMWYSFQTSPGGAWSGLNIISNGTGFTCISAVVQTNQTISVIGCGGGGVYVSSQSTPGGNFGSWVSLGGSGFTQVKALVFKNNCMAVVGCGNGTAVNYDVQTSPGGSWSGWSVLGGGTGFSAVSALVLSNQTVAAFGCGGGFGPVYVSQQSSVGGSFPPWTSLGGTGFLGVTATVVPSGIMSVFGGASDSPLWTEYQTSVGGSWTSWADLGGVLQ